MLNFWDCDVWSWLLLFAVLLGSLLIGNTLRRKIPLFRNSLIPTSVIGGAVLLIVAAIHKLVSGTVMFDTAPFGYNGTLNLEVIMNDKVYGKVEKVKKEGVPVNENTVREMIDMANYLGMDPKEYFGDV